MHRYNKKPIEIGRLQRFAMEDVSSTPAAGRGASAARVSRHARSPASAGGPPPLPARRSCAGSGFAVTVFDNRPLPGGLATYGIAEYKLRPSDSLREVEMIRAMGVEFRQADVGPTESRWRTWSERCGGLPGSGTRRDAAPWAFPGEQSQGVIDALRFIERYKTEEGPAIGGRVAVIGGGNTAIDAAIAARRLGAEEVHIFYRRTEAEMPCIPLRVRSCPARRRGVPLAGAAGRHHGGKRTAPPA